MAAVSIGFDNKYSHPLLEEMKREGSLNAYLLAVISAVLIAPLVEEFSFPILDPRLASISSIRFDQVDPCSPS